MAGNPHVLSVGVDLAPALDSNGADTAQLVDSIFKECLHRRGEGKIPKAAAQVLRAVANVLNIAWIEWLTKNHGKCHAKLAETCVYHLRVPFPREIDMYEML